LRERKSHAKVRAATGRSRQLENSDVLEETMAKNDSPNETIATLLAASAHRRQVLKAVVGGSAALAVGLRAPVVLGQSKQFQGVTLNVSCWSATYPKLLAEYIPEFTAKTGIAVNYDTPGFPVYNQRADLELSTQSSAFDVLNITFIFTSRWIGAGWFTPLDPFIKDPNKTPPDWDFADLLQGSLQSMRNKGGVVHGIPWLTDVLVSAAGRFDLFKASGLAMPDTFEDLDKALATLHKKAGVPAFLTENHWGWTFIPYLQGYGGNIFRNPPDDLMPTLDTPEVAQAAEFFAKIVTEYGPEGAAGYTYDQTVEALKAGRANYTTNNQVFVALMGDADSKVSKSCNFALMPKGPKGRFPGIATHGWGIPTSAKNKDASWEFIKWSMSKDLLKRMAQKHGLGSVTRKSIIESADYKERMVINGHDVGRLFLDTLAFAEQGHMTYRTVHVYPQVNAQITQAMGRVISGQMKAKESFALAQRNAMADLKRAGVRL
jgi:multiple sugar transport system substrate-binding protein